MRLTVIFFFQIFLFSCISTTAQSLEFVSIGLPLYVATANIKAIDGEIRVGIFSDDHAQIDDDVLNLFENSKHWNHKLAKDNIGHQTVKVISLNKDNLAAFDGQVIWVLDVDESLAVIKDMTKRGVFTIRLASPDDDNSEVMDSIFVNLVYINISNDPTKNKWRLDHFIANCEISPLRFSFTMIKRGYFIGKSCN